METKIKQEDSFKVVGMSLETILKDERENHDIPRLHQNFEKRISEIKNRKSDTPVGIFIDPPNYNPQTDPFKWIAGVEVSRVEDIPSGMESITIPANTYVYTTYKGKIEQGFRAYDYLYGWLDKSDYELADRYGVERYIEMHDDGTEVMNLMFPVKKRDS